MIHAFILDLRDYRIVGRLLRLLRESSVWKDKREKQKYGSKLTAHHSGLLFKSDVGWFSYLCDERHANV
jgi:hypothetical protein